jgi:Skp family chaperone for outer membrane proteins
MPKNTVIVAGVALLLAILALILQFVLPVGSGVTRGEFEALQDEVSGIEGQSAVRIAYVNAEDAFTVFTDAVADQRQRAADKAAEITELREEFLQSTISGDDYEQQLMELQAGLLDAQFSVDLSMIDKMVAADGFADIRGDLTALKEQAQPVVSEMKDLLSTTQTGVISSSEFQTRYTQLESAYNQLDQLLVSAASSKIVQAAKEISIEKGLDLVLRVKNVIIYRNPAALIDITDLVKARLSTYL